MFNLFNIYFINYAVTVLLVWLWWIYCILQQKNLSQPVKNHSINNIFGLFSPVVAYNQLSYFFEPLEQFEIVNGFIDLESGYCLFVTKLLSLFFYSHLIPAITFIFFLIFVFSNTISINNFTISNLLIFKLINNLFATNTQFAFENQNSFFFLYFLFLFILYHNFSGMFPFSYTTTSLVLASFFLSMTAFFFCSYYKYKSKWLIFFWSFFTNRC